MKRILIVFGTRPEVIKLAPVIKELLTNKNFEIRTCNTGQHREMVNDLLKFFCIEPDFDLNIMLENQSLDDITIKTIKNFGAVLDNYNPDIVLVQGDTTTAAICSLVSFYRQISVGHIEAGLRSYNKYSPFPEEINRLIISKIASYHFCPSEKALRNLEKENILENTFNVGNTVIDALFMTINIISEYERMFREKYELNYNEKLILITGHRRENFGIPIINICEALIEISKEKNVKLIYPVHMNPNVRGPVFNMLNQYENIRLIDPVDYPELVWLLKNSYMVITDSGGIQEEAPALGKPVLVTREVTERNEVIESGNAVLVGWNKEKIINYTRELLYNNEFYKSMAVSISPYGSGDASKKILSILENESN